MTLMDHAFPGLAALLLILAVLGSPVIVSGESLQSQQDRDWARVNQFIEMAYEQAEKENCTVKYITDNCKKAFGRAADEQGNYIEVYLKNNKNREAYAIATFDLGRLLERQGQDKRALQAYLTCLDETKVKYVNYNGSLKERAIMRFHIVERRLGLNAPERPKPGTTSWTVDK